jgi:hypothetical protein
MDRGNRERLSEPEDQVIITKGLAEIMLGCAKEQGTSIDKLTAEKQVAFLTAYSM